MITVIFEVTPAPGKREEYLEIAAKLKPELIKIKGFISIERFQSLTDPKKILSLSLWESEESVGRWRNKELHRAAQNKGRNGVFDDYRLIVADIQRDYGMNDRTQVPADSDAFHRSNEEKK